MSATAEQATRSRGERKALYEKVVSIADYQTDGPQLPGTTARVIRQICRPYGREDRPDRKHVDLAIQATVDNGDLITWTDEGGTVTRYTPTNATKLRKLHIYAAENGARELAGQAYRRLQEVTA